MSADDKIKILVVDDLEEKLLVYRAILDELGEEVVTASSGEEALKQLLRQEFAVILLDVNMPGMDGFETASLIRRRKKCARTPILFLTAYADEYHAVRGYAQGAVDYILTPVVPEILRTKVAVFVELFRMRQQVERQADERVSLAEERAKRMAAEEADRRKDEFLAVLGHELRNPLAGIVSGIQVLKMAGLGDEDAKEMQEVIDRQALHMSRLVDDLLDVSRISRGKVRLRKTRVELVCLVHDMLEAYRRRIQDGGLELQFTAPATPVWVDGDPTRLSQVVGNLVANAVKFTDPGGRIAVAVQTDEGLATVCVRDTGIGMEPPMVRRVFETFSQAENSLARSRGGLGLGLALVKGLVEMHGGEVEARSEGLGRGSDFTLRLPLGTAPLQSAVAPGLAADGQVGPLRILLVDDRRDAILPLRKMLQLMGHEVHTAGDGRTALARARETRPDVVFCDIGLPDLSGYEVAQAIRAEPELASAYLVAITGYGQEEDRRRALEAGFDNHAPKPIGRDDLDRILAAIPRPSASSAVGLAFVLPTNP